MDANRLLICTECYNQKENAARKSSKENAARKKAANEPKRKCSKKMRCARKALDKNVAELSWADVEFEQNSELGCWTEQTLPLPKLSTCCRSVNVGKLSRNKFHSEEKRKEKEKAKLFVSFKHEKSWPRLSWNPLNLHSPALRASRPRSQSTKSALQTKILVHSSKMRRQTFASQPAHFSIFSKQPTTPYPFLLDEQLP